MDGFANLRSGAVIRRMLMVKFKTIIASILGAACIFSLAACGEDSVKPKPNPEAETKENAAIIYNDAVEKLVDARSYTMTGSVNSSAVMGDVLTSVVTSVDCRFAKDENDNPLMLMNSEQWYDGKVLAHTTYYADGRYYITSLGENFFVDTNDFGDYDASMIVKPVEDTVITNYTLDETENGTQVRVEIPYGVYASEALDNLIGMFADDTLLQQPVTVRANIDKEGLLTSVYLEMENSTSFDGDPIEQSVIMSLQMTAYNETTVTAPQNLEAFEDRTLGEAVGQNPEGEELPEEFTGDSLD